MLNNQWRDATEDEAKFLWVVRSAVLTMASDRQSLVVTLFPTGGYNSHGKTVVHVSPSEYGWVGNGSPYVITSGQKIYRARIEEGTGKIQVQAA